MNKKLPGFTLIELLFALSLTGLVLVMGSGTFRIFLNFFHHFGHQTEASYTSLIFKDRLAKDFDQASFMEIYQKGSHQTELSLYDRSGEELFRYQFMQNWVLRNKAFSAPDSFSLQTSMTPFPSNEGVIIKDHELDLEYIFRIKKQAKAHREASQRINRQ